MLGGGSGGDGGVNGGAKKPPMLEKQPSAPAGIGGAKIAKGVVRKSANTVTAM